MSESTFPQDELRARAWSDQLLKILADDQVLPRIPDHERIADFAGGCLIASAHAIRLYTQKRPLKKYGELTAHRALVWVAKTALRLADKPELCEEYQAEWSK